MKYSLDYVGSGASFTRIDTRNALECPKTIDYVNFCFSRLQKENHTFSLLFNAFVEKDVAEKIQVYRKSVNSFYSDSGGLQIVTRGMVADDERKESVYDVQGRFSDLGFSFDEIPIKYDESATLTRNARTNHRIRYFDRASLKDAILASANNLKNQILYYEKIGSETKPIFIVQGNTAEDYIEWVELTRKTIGEELFSRVRGFALGGASLGIGELEEIKRTFYYSLFDKAENQKHLHLLAVGSEKKILPTVAFYRGGLFEGHTVSYDSTTQMCCPNYGRFFTGLGSIYYTRTFSKEYQFMFDAINEFVPGMDLDIKHFYKGLNTSAAKYEQETGDKGGAVRAFIGSVATQIKVFKDAFDQLLTDDTFYRKVVAEKYGIFKELEAVKTLSDFKKWEVEYGRYFKSVAVQTEKAVSLNDFI